MKTIELKPLLVSGPTARNLIGCGNTKFWDLVKACKIRMVWVGESRLVDYASLEELVHPAA